jgi:hypothetical protein
MTREYTHIVNNQSKAQSNEEMLPHVHMVNDLIETNVVRLRIRERFIQNTYNRILMNLFSFTTGVNLLNVSTIL